jgi:hypothetical protein
VSTQYEVKIVFLRDDTASLLFGFTEGKITGIALLGTAGIKQARRYLRRPFVAPRDRYCDGGERRLSGE